MGTKIILLGDPQQIDHPLLDERTNGLSYAAEKMKGSPLCWQVAMSAEECERSALAMDCLLYTSITEGKLPTNTNEILVPEHVASNGRVKYSLGQTLTLAVGLRLSENGETLWNNERLSYEYPEDEESQEEMCIRDRNDKRNAP